jgi:hypothetical protein
MKAMIVEKLERIFRECDKHLSRMSSAYHKTSAILPLDVEKYLHLSDEEIEHIDQYLFRFAKLQDTMGEKLFKLLLLFLDEEVENKPFADILNKMEKLLLIDDAQSWRTLRNIRNELSHQYDDDPEDMSIVLNKIFNEKSHIEAIYRDLKEYYVSHKSE